MKYTYPGFSNYRIYSDGRVQNRTTKQFLSHLIHPKGYHQVVMKSDLGEWKNLYVHRLVGKVFNPINKRDSKNRKICASHTDCNRHNNTKKNVYLVEAIKGHYTEKTRKAVIASRILVRTWTHPIHGDFTGSLSELVRAFPEQNLKQPMLTYVVQGTNSKNQAALQYKGWHLKGSLKNKVIRKCGKHWYVYDKETFKWT
jgi:hypothetical protein